MSASMASFQACKVCLLARSLQRFPNTRLFHKTCSAFQGAPLSVASNPDEDIVIPKRKHKDEFAVLRALGSTVGKDPTAASYIYRDDPYLIPRNLREKRSFKKTLELGRKAAQYVIEKNPKLFLAVQHDEPKIEAFYPPKSMYVCNDSGDDAIMERVEANDIQGSWQMYQATVEAGHIVSLETSNALLDLLCFYGNAPRTSLIEQVDESISQARSFQAALKEAKEQQEEDMEESNVEETTTTEAGDKADDKKDGNRQQQPRRRWQDVEVTWVDGNEAEQLFEAMEEKNAHSYNSMIQGLVKHNAHSKAFSIYNEMQQKGFNGDLLAYNALIEAVNFIREDSKERWKILQQLMKQMENEGVRPTLYTFNSLMASLNRNREVGRMVAMYTLNEMKALGIEPSLGTYTFLRRIFADNRNPVIEANVLYDILDEVEGKDITLRHPNDVYFFVEAMDVCLKVKDIELGYKLDAFLNTGNNCNLLGGENFQNMYYSRFFTLITQMENADAMLEYYDKSVPGALIPNADMYTNILHALETAEAYEKIPAIWKDCSNFYYTPNDQVVDTLLTTMAMAPTSIDDKLKEEFCNIATAIMRSTKPQDDRMRRGRRQPVRPQKQSIIWSSRKLNNMIVLYLKGQQVNKAWETLKYCMKVNQIPSSMAMEDFLAACISSGDNEKALGCVKVGVHFFMTGVPDMVERVKEEMLLSQDQRKHLDYILDGRK